MLVSFKAQRILFKADNPLAVSKLTLKASSIFSNSLILILLFIIISYQYLMTIIEV